MTQFCANLVNLACIVEFHKTLSGKATFFLRMRCFLEISFHERKLFVNQLVLISSISVSRSQHLAEATLALLFNIAERLPVANTYMQC